MSAFDQLERQLAESVSARRARRGASIAELSRWWRGRLHGGLLAAAASALLILVALSGGLPAGAGRAGSSEQASLGWASAAGVPEGSCPRCRAVGGRLHAPLREERAAGSPPGREPRGVLVRHGIPTVLW